MDTLFVVDTLRDTLIVRDTLTLIKDSSIANIVMAGGTILLALATFITLIVTHSWNKRNERNTQAWNREIEEWNKRNEWLRVLPLLNLRIPNTSETFPNIPITLNSANVKTIGLPDSKWIQSFELIAENTGFGPALTHEIHAQQGSNLFSYYTLSDSQSESSSFLAIGKPQRIKFEAENMSEVKGNAPHIKIEVKLRNLYGDAIEMNYTIVPFHYEYPKGTFITNIGIPLLISITLNGKKIEIPEANEIPSPND